MRDIVKGRLRKIRGGRFVPRPFGGPVRLLPAAQRRRDMEHARQDAKSTFPNLETRLDKIAKKIQDARMSGRRFAYKKPLRDLYKMAYRWNEAEKLNARVGQVAALRAIPVRSNANPFSVLVRAVLGGNADRKTISRWSGPLKRAMDKGVAPSDLNEHI